MMNINTAINPHTALAAAPDAIRLGAGEKVEHKHPMAVDLDLASIAYAAGAMNRELQPHEHNLTVMGRGMGTSEFSAALADGYRPRTLAAYESQSADVRAFCVDIEVRNFKPTDLPALDADIGLEVQQEFGANVATVGAGFLAAGARQAQLRTLSKTICISREAIVNDARSAIGEIFSSIGGTAARIQGRIVSATLEAPGLLDDGQPVFGSAFSNVVSGAVGFTHLREAMRLLRVQQTAAGLPADLKARHLIVTPDFEFDARSLVKDAGLDTEVHVLADLPAERWYLLADPAAHPVVALLRLAGLSTALRVTQAKKSINHDGALVNIAMDVGCCLLRRTGIVKGGTDL